MKLEELKAVEALGDDELAETNKQQIKSLHQEIVTAKARVDFCEMELREAQDRLKRQERQVNDCERAAEKYKAHIDQFIAWRDALLDNLKKRKLPMTTPARHTKRRKPRQTRPPRPR